MLRKETSFAIKRRKETSFATYKIRKEIKNAVNEGKMLAKSFSICKSHLFSYIFYTF